MAAAAGVTGLRSWLQARSWAWLTPTVLRRVTITTGVIALLVATLSLSGSSTPGGDARAAGHASVSTANGS